MTRFGNLGVAEELANGEKIRDAGNSQRNDEKTVHPGR